MKIFFYLLLFSSFLFADTPPQPPPVFQAPLVQTGRNITCNVASGSQAGCLSSTDWTTFNNKGTGSVTSVALSPPSSIISVSGSPITTSGTLTESLVSQSANSFWAGPTSGSASAPTFRAIVPTDVPTLNQNTTGTASNVTGVVAILNGGTGQTTANSAFNALVPSQIGNSGKFLSSDGTNTSWQNTPVTSPAAPSGSVQFNNSGVFGGSTNLFWDSTNNRLGIQTNTPTTALDTPSLFVSGSGTITTLHSTDAIATTFFAPHSSTAAGPVYTFQGGSPFFNTGMYMKSDTTLAFSHNSTEILVLNSAGSATLDTPLDMTSHLVHNVTDPVSAQDAATKNYVDTHSGGVTSVTASSPLASSGGSTPNISLTGIVTPPNGGAPPVTKNLYVDGARSDSYTADGSLARPFKTIGAAITQIITNGDNGTFPYNILIYPSSYNEVITLNNSTLHTLYFVAVAVGAIPFQNTIVTQGGNVLVSTASNTQLATVVFDGLTFDGSINLVGDVNGTNFGSSQILFSGCQFNNSSGTIILNNVNNVSFYNSQIQGTGSVSTFTNDAFVYMEGPEGFIGGTTLHLVQNNSANQPSQSSGNYFLMDETKNYATVTIDAGSEMDSLLSYFGSGSLITNNGIIHSWGSNWNGSVTSTSGSTFQIQGDVFLNSPTLTGATVTNNGVMFLNNLNASAVTLLNGSTQAGQLSVTSGILIQDFQTGTSGGLQFTTANSSSSNADNISMTGGSATGVFSGSTISFKSGDSTGAAGGSGTFTAGNSGTNTNFAGSLSFTAGQNTADPTRSGSVNMFEGNINAGIQISPTSGVTVFDNTSQIGLTISSTQRAAVDLNASNVFDWSVSLAPAIGPTLYSTFQVTLPTVACTGGSATVEALSQDWNLGLTVTGSPSVSTCTVTFTDTWLNHKPHCYANVQTATVNPASVVSTTTTAAIHFTTAITSATDVDLHCEGNR